MHKRILKGATILAVMGATGGTAMAADDVAAEEEAADDNVIIVTAAKREQTLQDTPIAVSVTDAETIEQAAIVDLADLQTVVPSLRVVTTSRVGNTNFIIRGFGSGGASVGVFIDGVYRSSASASVLDLPRVQRVEVLSGPQSTLFGKGTSAGVVSIVTKKPSFDLGGRIEATYGNYDQRIIKGHITGGLTDSLAATISGSWNKRDGFTKSLVGLGDLNNKDRWSVRGDLLFAPGDGHSLRLIADYSSLNELCCTTGNVINGPTAGVIQLLGRDLLPTDDQFAYQSVLNVDQENRIRDGGISAHGEFDLGGATLTSITAYRLNKNGPVSSDIDYTSLDLGRARDSLTTIDTFTQELRLTSDNDSRLSWMLGGFYFQEDREQTGFTEYGQDIRNYVNFLTGGAIGALENVLGMPGQFLPSGALIGNRATQDNTTYSVFATVDYELTDRLTVTGGINYTKDINRLTLDVVSNPDVFSQLDLDTLFGGAFAGLKSVQFRPAVLEFPNVVEDGISSDETVTWLARAAYEVNDNINIYGSVGTGFKPTNWSLGAPFRRDQAALEAAGLTAPGQRYAARFSEPEYATVYELGLKANFDGGYFNLAVFEQSIRDFQTLAFDGVTFINSNAGKLRSRGFEFDLVYSPIQGLTLTAAGTYLDPEYVSYTGAPPPFGTPGNIDRSGTRPGGIHPFSGTFTATYAGQLSDNISGFVRGEFLFESKAGLTDTFPQFDREVKTFNASAGLTFNETFSVQAWVRNLTKDEYYTGGFNGVAQPGSVYSFLNAPRTYGLTAGFNF